MNRNKERLGQTLIIDTILSRIAAGEPYTSVVAATGYGKSDIARSVAYLARTRGLVATTMCISPNDDLRGQIVERSKLNGWADRYGVDDSPKCSEVTSLVDDLNPNNEFLLSIGIQLLQRQIDSFKDLVDSLIAGSGLPVLVFVDETQTYSHSNKWGDAVSRLQKAGALVVVMTATAMREDGDWLVGFEPELMDTEQILKKVRGRVAEDGKRLVQLFDGTRSHYKLKPHVEVSFAQAWEEGVLCKISHHGIDIDLDDGQTLAKVSESQARAVLGRVVRSPHFIKQSVQMTVDRLEMVRSSSPMARDCAAIVFTNNDVEGETNGHAKAFKDAFRRIAPHLKVVIATSADEGEKGTEVLSAFRHGDGDILICKQMSALGTDVPRLKVCLDGSAMRAPAGWIQRINRTTRPYNGIMQAHLIHPLDPLSETCFEAFIEAEGGAFTESVEFLKDYFEDAGEPTEAPEKRHVIGAREGGVVDTDRRYAGPEKLALVLTVLEQFPMLSACMSWPQIVEAATKLRITPPPKRAEPENTSDSAAAMRSTINAYAIDIVKSTFLRKTKRSYQGSKDDSAVWGTISRGLWGTIYRSSEAPMGTELKDVNDLALLERIQRVVENLAARETET